MKFPVEYMKAYNSDGVEGALSTIHQNYCTQLYKLDEDVTKNIENAAMGAGLGGRFSHNRKQKVMIFMEAINRLDSNKWKEDIKSEHTRMVMNNTWVCWDKEDLPEEAKVISLT